MSESPSGPRSKRQRIDKNGRFAAMERLRQLKGTKNKCQVGDHVDDVYDVVDEREYAKRAQEKYGDDWIEEDGTGYAEDHRDFFEDEDEFSDGEEEPKDRTKKKGVAPNSKKRPREDEKPAKGKASIKNLFSTAVPKKPDIKNSVKDDDILADILGEMKEEPAESSGKMENVIAPAKIAVASRKSDAAAAKEYMNSFLNNIKVQEQERKKAEASSDNEMLERILKPKAAVSNTKVAFFSTPSIKKEQLPETDPVKEGPKDPFSDNMDFSCLDDDENKFDVEKEQPKEEIFQTKTEGKKTYQAKVAEKVTPKAEITESPNESEPEEISKLLSNWESICQMDDDFEKSVLTADQESPISSDEQLRFWYWEAWEDPIKLPGEVFLFGRTADGKSVCVRVQNINRVLYLLPRQYEPTEQKVTVADIYKEFDSEVASELKLESFRSRKVSKNFAHHAIGIEVPQTCDYLEVHYDGKKPPPNVSAGKKYNSIAHIFGSTTNALERFLLERKIKGPCWLQVSGFKQVLKLNESERMDVNADDLLEMYEKGESITKLVSLTMQDNSYLLRLMCELNIMPLAMQITNICGNTMTRTLQGGRSERNEFLLLHAFYEKNYIVPDKKPQSKRGGAGDPEATLLGADATLGAKKKAAYAGGLVLEPMRGLYEKFVLLMDFNSLYPSIIQEYNICFTTVQQPVDMDELPTLPNSKTEAGILPLQLKRLVESRKEVKKLMAAPDLSPELQMQYHIRQMALKLTANSMYGCLGFAHSRFFAQHLAALVTHKGREILTNTQQLVQKLNYDVVYGDTDSLMINTNITDYDQVFKIGHSIKQSVNKLYKQLELDIDGVFACLLLLKKKKYAAVKLSKDSKGNLKREQEHKGLDIVRRDWSQLAVMVGKAVLDEVLSEKQLEEKLDAVHAQLEKIKNQIKEGAVPLPLFVITKQLTRAPQEYANSASLPHVQVALRMNRERNRRYKKGDMVDYVICLDGSTNAAMQRAYHLDELKSSEDKKLQLDMNYYLGHQVHPVVTRMVEVLEGTDASRIAECLGMDPTKFRQNAQRAQREITEQSEGESLLKTTLQLYRLCEPFRFQCVACKAEQLMASAYRPGPNSSHISVLQQCVNSECQTAPVQYLASIRNQLQLSIRRHVQRFYKNWLVCDHPDCNYNTRTHTLTKEMRRPLCHKCRSGSLLRQYTERDLYNQLCYLRFIFDLGKQQLQQKPTLTPELEQAYQLLYDTVDQQLQSSSYVIISLKKLFGRTLALMSLQPPKPTPHNDLIASSLADVV
ncbi:hypothetical protein M5D96_000983 [Drosophila gunungcola]|uniref:DNA polymerase n=1 Tax=Drosophila gunungcola TaxID=103775 RepID=A0A9Q0BUM0_9MUSC|nr:hypothetical protein M5D96_000983 [Drosophila gunungcola]